MGRGHEVHEKESNCYARCYAANSTEGQEQEAICCGSSAKLGLKSKTETKI